MTFAENQVFLLALTIIIYCGASALQKRIGLLIFNPLLITIALLIAYLQAFNIDYPTYHQAGAYIDFWLKPAIVCLGLPMYRQLRLLREQFIPVMISQFVGCIIGIISVVCIAQLCGASREIVLSLAPKSVTTPIAIEVSNNIGGIPSLTAAIVIIVGIIGATFGFKILHWAHIDSPMSQGIGIGTASHALGTAQASSVGEIHGVFSSLGMIINGVLTAILAPYVLHFMGML